MSSDDQKSNAAVTSEADSDTSLKSDLVADLGRHEDPDGDADTEETVAAAQSDTIEKSVDISKQLESNRRKEVPALLGKEEIPDDEESEASAEQPVKAGAVLTDSANHENRTNKSTEEKLVIAAELQHILETLQDSLANTQNISAKIDAVSSDSDRLMKQVNGISMNCEVLTAEMETITSIGSTKNALSKTFLIIVSVAVALLIIFQIYIFTSLMKVQRIQNAAGSTVLQNISGINKKMADYDKNLKKAIEQPAQQEHTQPVQTATQKVDSHEKPVSHEAAPANVTPVAEKLNRLRNGLPERKLIRKETGDWFVLNKKIEESIADVEVIEALNQAYRKIGRSLSPGISMPSHNALCILKPDGKGGTEVVMTKNFVP
jgi:hypothetical protein